jgi:multidrug resistance protein, MATE family
MSPYTAPAIAAEARTTLKLALPLIVAQLSHMGMGFIDTVMAGQLGAAALSAIGLGGALWSVPLVFALGTLFALPALIAESKGAKDLSQVREIFQQSLYFTLALSVLVFIAARSGGALLLNLMQVRPELKPDALKYLHAVSLGAPAVCFYIALKGISDGLSFTKPAMYVGLLGLALNAPMNYVFMYGKLGLPAYGAVGTGYATAVVLWLQMFAILLVILYSRRTRGYALWQRFGSPHARMLLRIARVGLPVGLAMFMEVSLFAAVALLMGGFSVLAVSAHQVAINFASITFMVPMGIALAITVRVGDAFGARDLHAVRLRGAVGIGVAMVGQTFAIVLMLTIPQSIAGIYTADAAVIALAAQMLVLAGIFQLSDGLQVAAAGALRGLQDTRAVMLITIAAYWLLGFPLGLVFGYPLGFGPLGLWYGLIAGLSFAAVALIWRWRRRTRSMTAMQTSPGAGL